MSLRRRMHPWLVVAVLFALLAPVREAGAAHPKAATNAAAASAKAADADDPVLSPEALAKGGGEAIYRHVCQGCHMPDGRGATGAGAYPALAGDPRLASARYMAAVVANGRRNMPHFAPQADLGGFENLVVMHLDDAEIAAVVNYVRSHFGNAYPDRLTAADVARLH